MVATKEIQPLARRVDATVTIPGSKSYTNRVLPIAALARGKSTLRSALFSEDTEHMSDALRKLGVNVTADEAAERFDVEGCDGKIPATKAELFVGNSGTSARFLVSVAALGHGSYTIDGIPRMRERPVQELLDGLAQLGVKTRSVTGNGCPPVEVEGRGMPGGRTRMSGEISSQYFTSILLASPYAQRDVEIEVLGTLVSQPYLDMTLASMRDFGVESERDGYRWFKVRAGQHYTGRVYDVEPDATNATYFFAAAALTGGRVRVRNLSLESAQGDVHFAQVLEKMGCRVQSGKDYIEVVGPERLHGIEVDLAGMSDTAQTLAAVAPFADSPTVIRGIGFIRSKETDRIAAVAKELRKLGVGVTEDADGVTIQPASRIRPAAVDTYDDHRMAMSFALIGLRAAGVTINDPGCVAKTFPNYFEKLAELYS